MFSLLLSLALAQEPVATSISPLDPRNANLLREAREAKEKGNFQKATRLVLRVVRRTNEHPHALIAMGDILIAASQATGDPRLDSLATASYQMAIEKAPESREAQMLRSLIDNQGPPALPQAQVSCPPSAENVFNAAEKEFANGELDRAADLYESALALCPDKAEWWTWYGDVWFRKGELTIAEEKYRRAIRLEPCQLSAWRFLADVQVKRGEINEAWDSVTHAVACDPTYERGWVDYQMFLEARKIPVDWRSQVNALDLLFRRAIAELPPSEASSVDVRANLVRQLITAQPQLVQSSARWRGLASAEANGRLDTAVLVLLYDNQLQEAYLRVRADRFDSLHTYVRDELPGGLQPNESTTP